MPSIGVYLSDSAADAIKNAVKQTHETGVSPWIAEACRQRLEREGMLPGNPKAEIIAAAEEIGMEKAVDVLRRAARRVKKGAA